MHIYTSMQTNVEGSGIGPGATLAPQEDETVLMGTGTDAGPGERHVHEVRPDPAAVLGRCVRQERRASSGTSIDYGNAGGRFFATHYSYSWLHGNGVLEGTAQWDPKANPNNTNPPPTGQPFTGNVARERAGEQPWPVRAAGSIRWARWPTATRGARLRRAPTVTINAGRHDVDKVLGSSIDWIDGTDPSPPTSSQSQMLLHFTFDMPIGQTSQCGHAIYSDFHVNTTTSNGMTFPNECDKNALTAQERVLEYMIWDLASCVPGPPTSSCTPKTCADQHLNCGPAGDGCGNLIPGGCGATCPTAQTCGGCGTPGVCGSPPASCAPETCADQHITCGPAGDGCGNALPSCGVCVPPATCGGGGVAGQCGSTKGCVPRTCQDLGITCGPAGDGCGNLIAGGCGTCTAPATCGGAGVPGQCGSSLAR